MTLLLRILLGLLAVAAAIDHMEYSEVVGSIAGDDTIMIAIHTAEEAQLVLRKLRELVDR